MEKPSTTIRGKVYVLGDNIDTDQIIPAKYLNLVPTIPDEYHQLGSHALSGLPDGCPPFMADSRNTSDYAVIIADKNFGCGSSREHAPICLGAAGVKAVVAQSYARIFFRNAVATGEVYPLECTEKLSDIFATGDEVEIDLEASQLTHCGSGKTAVLKPLGAVAPVIEAGGIFDYARSVGMIQQRPGNAAKTDPVPDSDDSDSEPDETEPDEPWMRAAPEPAPEPAHEPAPAPKIITPVRPRRRSKTRIIAVANQKGGVGKTTTVINLSACLGLHKKKVLVVDLDPQANATSGLGLAPQQGTSLYRTLLGEVPIETLPQKTVVKNVEIIPSELDLAGSEVEIARTDNYLHCFSSSLAPLVEKGRYDFVIIDCPPSLGILTMNALTAADSMIVPIQCEYYALEGLSVVTRLINQLHETGANPDIEIEGILMTMYDSRTRLASQVVREVRKHFKKKVYRNLIPRNVRLSEAPSYGKPVIMYDYRSTGAKAYVRLSKEFLKRDKVSRRRRKKS